MGKVILNEERCIGCGACMSVAPDNFTFSDEGRAEIINSNITDAAIEASEVCPVSAITIENNCECGHDCNCDDNCNCGDDCNCGDNCNCGDDCNCDDNCNCGDDCNCENDCDESCSCGCNK